MKNLTPIKTTPTQGLSQKQIAELQVNNAKLVRGRFKDYEVPGGELEFTYGPIYKGDQTYTYSRLNGNALRDGEIYELPRGVAIHLNKDCWYPEFEHRKGEEVIFGTNQYGQPNAVVTKKVHRFGFQSLDFDGEDISPTPTLFTAQVTL